MADDEIKIMLKALLESQKSLHDRIAALEERKKAQPKKVRFDQKYHKMTIYILKDLVDLINEEAAGERGEKTRIINEALKMYFGLK